MPQQSGKQGPSMTLKMAVNLLTEKDQEVQITAANYIQNQCFSSADAKKKVTFMSTFVTDVIYLFIYFFLKNLLSLLHAPAVSAEWDS